MNTPHPDLAEIATQVKARMHDAFPAYPVTVQSSPDDMLVLCVRVFAVPTNQIDQIQDFIFDLQDNLIAKTEFMLLPMVKNIEVTRQFYPEHLIEPVLSVVQIAAQFLLEAVRQPSEWQPAKRGAMCANDYRTAPARLDFNMGKITGGKWTSTPICENAVPSNTEVALAANTELALAA